jgi:acetyl-CoA synthetase
MDNESNTWHPGPAQRESSGIVRLMRALGVSTYEDLLALSNTEPAQYWDVVMKYCEIAWDTPPQGYIDTSAGPEFPCWFPGGRLNWVNTVLAWSRKPQTAARAAVVAEREDGQVKSLTYAELETAVREFAAGLAKLGVARGDRVGLLTENGIEATVSLLAIAYLGAIVVPLFSGFGVDAIVARLSAAQASALIATTGFARRGKRVDVETPVREAWAKLPSLQRVVWKRADGEVLRSEREVDWQDVARAGKGSSLAPVTLSPDDAFMVIYT